MSRNNLFDGSDSHLMPRGISECADYLRRHNAWRRGDNSPEPLNPRELGLNIDFAIEVMDAIAGHDHLMVIAATRYCLGRMTYVVGECASWLIKTWPLLSQQTQNIIKRDIEDAFARDDEDREADRDFKALGWDCDRAEWSRVRKLWAPEYIKRRAWTPAEDAIARVPLRDGFFREQMEEATLMAAAGELREALWGLLFAVRENTCENSGAAQDAAVEALRKATWKP